MDWEEALLQMAQADPAYQQTLRQVKEKERVFLEIRSKVDPQEQEKLDSYIASCEELEHCMVRLAYDLGRKTGRQEQ